MSEQREVGLTFGLTVACRCARSTRSRGRKRRLPVHIAAEAWEGLRALIAANPDAINPDAVFLTYRCRHCKEMAYYTFRDLGVIRDAT